MRVRRFVNADGGGLQVSHYYLGVDIGGSKSHALVADENGYAVGFGEGGPGNHETVGWDGLRETLQAIVRQALASAGITREQIHGAGFGVAGYDWPAEWEPTQKAIASLQLCAPFEIVNDAVIALLAGATRGWGVAVIAGTSNNCRGRDSRGREGRVTGCGPSFGEYGGATEIVARAVQAVSKAWSRRGPATRLTEAFIALVGAVDSVDLLEGLALRRYHLSHLAVRTVFQVAAQGDAVAQEIIRWAGCELGSLAVGVIHQLGMEEQDFDVVLAGSLYEGGPALTEALQATVRAVAPRARLVRLTVPPVVGGVLLGMEQGQVQTGDLRSTLVESTREMLEAVRA